MLLISATTVSWELCRREISSGKVARTHIQEPLSLSASPTVSICCFTTLQNELHIMYLMSNETTFYQKYKIQNLRLCAWHHKMFHCGFSCGSYYESGVQQVKWLLPCARLVIHEKSSIGHLIHFVIWWTPTTLKIDSVLWRHHTFMFLASSWCKPFITSFPFWTEMCFDCLLALKTAIGCCSFIHCHKRPLTS